jgi:SnoaL-like domain
MQIMGARREIERLLFDYCWGIDHGDFELTASLFGTAGLYGLVGGAAARGSEQVLGMLQASTRRYDGVPRTRHVVTNVVIDVAENSLSGSSRSYVQVIHQPPAEAGDSPRPIGPIVVGTYLDKVHNIDGMWQFAERRMDLQLIGDLSTHLNPGFL